MNDDTVCPKDGKQYGDHTFREMSKCHPANDLNLPFEATDPQQQSIQSMTAGGLVVMAASIKGTMGKFPALVFRFVQPDGINLYPDMTLVLDETAMRNTAALVNQSVSQAIKASKL